MTRIRGAILIVLIAVLLTTGLAVAQQLPRAPMDWVIAKRLTVETITLLTGDVTTGADVTVGADMSVAGDVTFDGEVDANGDATFAAMSIDGAVVNNPADTIVVTHSITVTPLGVYQPISSTGNTGTSIVTGCTAGREVTMVNQANTTITFTDTGTLKLSGNAALGQYDSLTLRCHDGTNWIEVAQVDS